MSNTVPNVYCASRRKELTYIVMETLEGETVDHRWKLRTKDSRAQTLDQLKDMMLECEVPLLREVRESPVCTVGP